MKITIEISDQASDPNSKTLSIKQAAISPIEGALSQQTRDGGSAHNISSGLFTSSMQNRLTKQAKDGGAPTVPHPLVNAPKTGGATREINQGVAPFPTRPLSGSSNAASRRTSSVQMRRFPSGDAAKLRSRSPKRGQTPRKSS